MRIELVKFTKNKLSIFVYRLLTPKQGPGKTILIQKIITSQNMGLKSNALHWTTCLVRTTKSKKTQTSQVT